MWLVLAVGIGVGIAVAGLTYSVLAVPLYVFAQSDPDGLDRPMIRTAFFNVALPVANAGSAGDVDSARRAELASGAILTWAAGYYLGLTAPGSIAAPTLVC